jgi:predicted permease
VLGVAPAAGRFFTEAEDSAPDAEPVAVLSHEFWQRQFAGAADVLGRSLWVGKQSVTVIGIAPPGFTGVELAGADLWLPLGSVTRQDGWRHWPQDRGTTWLSVIARLRPGVDREIAQREAIAANQRGWLAIGKSAEGELLRLGPLLRARDTSRSPTTRVTFWLAGVAAAVLLVAAANVSGLLLVRAQAREHEFAVRQALGAGAARLARQVLLESLLLGLLAAALAVWFAEGTAALLRVLLLPEHPVRLPADLRIWAFTAGLAALTGLGCGLWPVLRLRRFAPASALQSRAGTGRAGGLRLRHGFLAGQVALTLMVLVAAGLFLRSLRLAVETGTGLAVDRLLILTLRLDGTEARPGPLHEEVRAAVRAVPGVEEASLAVNAPFRSTWYQRLIPAGREGASPPQFGVDFFNELINCVTPDYFAATGLRVVRGRGFTEADRAGAPPVLVVNESFARMLAPDGDVLGRRYRIQGDAAPLAEVVGVVADSKATRVLGPMEAQWYVPYAQPMLRERPATWFVLVRTRGEPAAAVETVRRGLAARVPGLPPVDLRPLAQEIEPQLAPWRLGARALGLFGGLALLLAAVGVYGSVGHAVARRTREIGLRVALGASLGRVQRLVVWQGCQPALLGAGAGLLAAGALARLLRGLLYGVTPADPATFLAAPLLLLAVVGLAAWLPARRAARVDPVVALRSE